MLERFVPHFVPGGDPPRQPPKLTDRDRAILKRWGEPLRQLYAGERAPQTPAQAHFVEATHGRVQPTTRYETAFIALLRLKAAEKRKAEEPVKWQPWAPTSAEPPRRATPANIDAHRQPGHSVETRQGASNPDLDTPLPARAKRRARRRSSPENPELRSPSIPEYEDGVPRPGWYTDDDWRKMHPERR
jgi:uncharacterized protein YifE (UPF0438 family)